MFSLNRETWVSLPEWGIILFEFEIKKIMGH